MSVAIPLSRGLFAVIDDDDEAVVAPFKWHAKVSGRLTIRHYALTGRGGSKPSRTGRIYMHRLIMGAKEGQLVDHINGDGLDNRKSNLRFATHALNLANSVLRNPASGFRGVYLIKPRYGRGYYRAFVGGRPNRFIGPYRRTAIEAAADHDAEAAKRFGEFATLNFP